MSVDSFSESEMHRRFQKWLNENHIHYYHARTDRRATIRVGLPDFGIFHCDKSLLIELKVEKGRLSVAQKRVFADIQKHSGMVTHLCRSVEECVKTTQEWLGVINGVDPQRALSHEAPVSGNGVSDGKGDRYRERDWDGLKRGVAHPPVNGTNGEIPTPGDSTKLFIGNFRGEDWVFQQLGEGNNAVLMHKADSHDLQTLPRGMD